jgi:hypothetical protein
MNFEKDDEKPIELPAQEWRQLRLALGTRLSTLKSELVTVTIETERRRLQREIEVLDQQVQKLIVEESVAQFVEDAERYVIAQSALSTELEDDSGKEADFFRA